MVLETIRMAPERPRMVPEGLGSAPEGSGMSRNDPRRSWKVPGSTTHYPTPLALGASHLGCPKSSKGWGAKYGRNPTPSRIAILLGGGFPGGKVSLWKEESQGDSTSPYCAPRASWPPI